MHRLLIATSILFLGLPSYCQPTLLTDDQRNAQAKPLINQGKSLQEAGQYEQSRLLLEQACSFDPNRNSAVAHANLAITLERLGDYQSAKAQYLVAFQFSPDRPTILYNLALCCEQMGQIDEAIAYLRDYLKKDPSGKFYSEATRLIAQLQTVSRISDNPNTPDYFASAVGNKIARWSTARNIKVFIEPSERVLGYDPLFKQALIDAFSQWMKAINNYLPLQLTSSEQEANIVCYWVSDRSQYRHLTTAVGAEGGKTHYLWVRDPYHPGEYLINNVEIGICTMNLSGKTPMTTDQARSICLHEIGHALGLSGHSSNNNDAMFFAESFYRPVTQLSDRDKATIARLYQLVGKQANR